MDALKETPASGPTGASRGATDTYAVKVQRRVRPHIVWGGYSGPRETTIKVRCAPTGAILSLNVVRSSGDESWDAAALRAVARSSPMPLDANGQAPASFQISIRPY
ncbi:energy transducer TonB [Caballeronia choica]|uniref:energy transducer TonB n=1 Tax=Caballeronia choica TaxID=326476 RepID=UPI001F3E12A3|nr:energy transducer TonB [Caballeronia choica]